MARKEPKVGTMGPKPKGTLDEYVAKPTDEAAKDKEHDMYMKGVTNPNRTMDVREKKAGLKAGGQVKGTGCAQRGVRGAQLY